MTVTTQYTKTVSADSAHTFIHELCLAAIEHGHNAGCKMEQREDATGPHLGGGTHSITFTADTPSELADEIAAQAKMIGDQFGYDVEFHDTPQRVGDPPVHQCEVERLPDHVIAAIEATRKPPSRDEEIADLESRLLHLRSSQGA